MHRTLTAIRIGIGFPFPAPGRFRVLLLWGLTMEYERRGKKKQQKQHESPLCFSEQSRAQCRVLSEKGRRKKEYILRRQGSSLFSNQSSRKRKGKVEGETRAGGAYQPLMCAYMLDTLQNPYSAFV